MSYSCISQTLISLALQEAKWQTLGKTGFRNHNSNLVLIKQFKRNNFPSALHLRFITLVIHEDTFLLLLQTDEQINLLDFWQILTTVMDVIELSSLLKNMQTEITSRWYEGQDCWSGKSGKRLVSIANQSMLNTVTRVAF